MNTQTAVSLIKREDLALGGCSLSCLLLLHLFPNMWSVHILEVTLDSLSEYALAPGVVVLLQFSHRTPQLYVPAG